MTTTIFYLNHFFTLTYTNKNKSKVYLGEKILIILLLMQHWIQIIASLYFFFVTYVTILYNSLKIVS